MQKTTLLTFSLSFLLTLPATAQLGKVWTDFQSYSVDLQNYLRNNLSDTLSPLELQTQTAISGTTGDLNIPNPVAASQMVRDSMFLNQISDKFENNSAVRATLVSHEINRLITRGSVLSVMGSNGQIRFKTKLENTESALENIDQFTEEADNMYSESMGEIQGIMSQIAAGATNLTGLLSGNQTNLQANLQLQTLKVQNEQSKILGENLAQTIQENQFLQYSNLNLANISQQVEESNRARRVNTSVEAARLLRNTAQIDLFGREY